MEERASLRRMRVGGVESEKEHMHTGAVGVGREREREGMYARRREREQVLGSSFYMFSFPWACPMQIGLSQEYCST